MTLNKVEVRTDQGVLLPLPLEDISAGYLVEDIQGLDPVPANVVSSSMARLDGEQFQSARREKRNIVYRIGLEPDYVNTSVQELRNNLYRFFLPKKNANMRFFRDENPTVDISGIVESFVCPLFVRDPAATISVLCMDPDFNEPVQITVSGATVSSGVTGEVDYSGTVDTGFRFEMLLDRDLTAFTIYNEPEGETAQAMAIAGNFLAGDRINISTIPGEKYAHRTRGGIATSILYSVSPYAVWTKFQPGINNLRVYAEGAAIPYTVRYTNKHGGL